MGRQKCLVLWRGKLFSLIKFWPRNFPLLFPFCRLHFWANRKKERQKAREGFRMIHEAILWGERRKSLTFYWVFDALIERRLTNSSNFIDRQWHIASTCEGLNCHFSTPKNCVPTRRKGFYRRGKKDSRLNDKKNIKNACTSGIWHEFWNNQEQVRFEVA